MEISKQQSQYLTNKEIKLKQLREELESTYGDHTKTLKKIKKNLKNQFNTVQKDKNGPKSELINHMKPAPGAQSMENFNQCVRALNQFIYVTTQRKSQMERSGGSTNVPANLQSNHVYLKIVHGFKILGFPQELQSKTHHEILNYLKTKDFIVMLKSKMHQYFSKLCVS